MATVLDTGLLGNFGSVFTFLLIFAVVLAILNYTKVFKDSGPGINAIIALCLAALSLFVPLITTLVSKMSPWFVIMFMFIVFVLIAYKLFGISDEDITSTVKAQGGIKWVIIIFALIIFVGALSSAYGPGLMPVVTSDKKCAEAEDGTVADGGESTGSSCVSSDVATGDFGANVKATLFHPKVVGAIFVLILGCAAIGLLGGKGK